MRKIRRLGWIAATLVMTGCLGGFNLTQQVHHWNGTVTDSKWANECIFLGCIIIPVYEIGLMCDGIIFNSVEFWSGKNWISSP
jgi:hypothetical protein